MQGVTLQLGLERSMPLQQIEGGGIKEHRGYLGVITITSIACHDHTGHTCQNLSGMRRSADQGCRRRLSRRAPQAGSRDSCR